jgi:hypothetical protein
MPLERGGYSSAQTLDFACFRGMSSDARDFNNIETRSVIRFFFLQDKAPKEIDTVLQETLGEYTPSYAMVK